MEKGKQTTGIQELDKTPLFCNQMTISHTPTEFFIDFRLVYPQFAPDNTQTMMVIHKTILFEPHHLKDVLKIIEENIKRYEKEYGKIKTPDAVKRAKKKKAKSRILTSSVPDYLG